ncbi:MAG: hypothetical protein VZS44_08580 [Bacilli bacterium]|nr:hypothetical protein [Bacilli bacterium]
MIRINSEKFKLLIIHYNIAQYYCGYFNIMISCNEIKKTVPIYYDTTNLLFMNTKHNTTIKVDYYAFRYYDYNIITNLNPKRNYFIEICI